MLQLKNIEDALIADVLANIAGIKTCATHEREFDDMLLSALLPRVPFVLIRYGGTNPTESERKANGASGLNGREFHLTIGAESLRSIKESQRGCYDIIDDLRERYDGYNLSVSGESVTLTYDGDNHRFTGQGVVVYNLFLKWDEN
jgi:phage gp37-like protein